MSSTNMEKSKERQLVDDHDRNLEHQVVAVDDDDDGHHSLEELKDSDENGENPMLSPQQEEEEIKKKYGGILTKKKPLISKDHERAFFDSADWALGKQGSQKPKGPLEALRPKLQPNPQHQVRSRRSTYAPADDCNVDAANTHTCYEDENCPSLAATENNTATQNQSFHG